MRLPATILLRTLGFYARLAPTERGGYALVRGARRLIPSARWRDTFRLPGGLFMSLDLGVYPDCCMAVGLYELDTARQIRRLLKPGGWFVDCGANIGYFTLLAAGCVGSGGRVDAFEPDPDNVVRLRGHVAGNGFESVVRVHPVALMDRPGPVDLYFPTSARSNHGMVSVHAGFAGGEKKARVDAARLDDVLPGVPDLVKVDVEGAEWTVLDGMSRLLNSPSPPALIIEYNETSARVAGHEPTDLLDKVRGLIPGSRIFWIGSRLEPIRTIRDLDRRGRQGNLLILPSRRGA